MGKRNRVKRAAKKRERQRRGPTLPRWPGHAATDSVDGAHSPDCTCGAGGWSSPPQLGPVEAAQLLREAATSAYLAITAPRARAAELTAAFAGRVGVLATAAGIVLGSALRDAWRNGWLPVDVWEAVRRSGGSDAADLVLDSIAADAAQYATATVHERWAAQVDRLGAAMWWEPGRPHLEQWAERRAVDLEDALVAAIELLGGLARLGRLPEIVPPPGTAHRGAASSTGVDQKVLARVRGLLAKAESTEFPEEAEALSAKAQELMNRHAFERALLDADRHEKQTASSIRLWLDGPYLDAKSHLVSAIAKANRCKSVFYSAPGFVALVGEELDLEITELLATSLLVQATRAMVAEGSHTLGGSSRTRSFRRAFLIAYAVRIGERLSAVSTSAHDPAEDPRLLPVLAARSRAVEEAFAAMFPDTVRRKSTSVSNGAGWHAGRAAADRANLDVDRRAIPA